MKLDVYAYSNAGGRGYNEDSFSYKEKDGHGLYVVADGLGGHQHGEMASACICVSLLEGWTPDEEGDRSERLKEQIGHANRKLLELQQKQQAKMKSTVVALAIDEDQAAWAHVGDSRLYYLHGKELQHVTEDHSVAYKKYKAGEITKPQIAWDEDQSCLLRSLGNEERYEADIFTRLLLRSGDAFLLCTDGAWEYLQDEEILIEYLKSDSAEEWAENLLLRIMGRIGADSDNLTLLTVALT